jgi:hypothetical protein
MGTCQAKLASREKQVTAMSRLGASLAADQDDDERAFAKQERKDKSVLVKDSKTLQRHVIGNDVSDSDLQWAFESGARDGKTPTSVSVPVSADRNGLASAEKERKAGKSGKKRKSEGGGGGDKSQGSQGVLDDKKGKKNKKSKKELEAL